jgi:hypothetical protein
MDIKKTILVMGSGRSGTTLCMYLLEALGAHMSPEMIAASPQNPDGGREDTEVFAIHQNLLRALYSNTYLPLPAEWQKHEAVHRAVTRLEAVVASRVQGDAQQPWAVKDPNLSLFLPLWTRLFNAKKLLPAHIVCIRHPEVVARSMESQYGQSAETSMMMWMLRNAYALVHTGGNCLIAHYEDWETNPAQQLRRLAAHGGLGTSLTDGRVNDILARVYEKNLNRTGYVKEARISNPHVRRLYDALRSIDGGEIVGREAVIAAEECLDAFANFKGLALVAQGALKKVAALQKRQEPAKKSSEPSPVQRVVREELEAVKRNLETERTNREAVMNELEAERSHCQETERELESCRTEIKCLRDDMASMKLANENLLAHVRFLEGLLARLREQALTSIPESTERTGAMLDAQYIELKGEMPGTSNYHARALSSK